MGFQVVHRLGLRIFTYSLFFARGIAVASIASGFIVFVADVRILFFYLVVFFFFVLFDSTRITGLFRFETCVYAFFSLSHPPSQLRFQLRIFTSENDCDNRILLIFSLSLSYCSL